MNKPPLFESGINMARAGFWKILINAVVVLVGMTAAIGLGKAQSSSSSVVKRNFVLYLLLFACCEQPIRAAVLGMLGDGLGDAL